LAVLLLLSLSDAQLMRRDSSRAASRRSRLQGALREALAKVSAEQVLFVEDGDAAEG
jgi:DNA gyrase/topoisomerase IV subunit B